MMVNKFQIVNIQVIDYIFSKYYNYRVIPCAHTSISRLNGAGGGPMADISRYVRFREADARLLNALDLCNSEQLTSTTLYRLALFFSRSAARDRRGCETRLAIARDIEELVALKRGVQALDADIMRSLQAMKGSGGIKKRFASRRTVLCRALESSQPDPDMYRELEEKYRSLAHDMAVFWGLQEACAIEAGSCESLLLQVRKLHPSASCAGLEEALSLVKLMIPHNPGAALAKLESLAGEIAHFGVSPPVPGAEKGKPIPGTLSDEARLASKAALASGDVEAISRHYIWKEYHNEEVGELKKKVSFIQASRRALGRYALEKGDDEKRENGKQPGARETKKNDQAPGSW